MSGSEENNNMTPPAQALVQDEMNQQSSVDVCFDAQSNQKPVEIDEEQHADILGKLAAEL